MDEQGTYIYGIHAVEEALMSQNGIVKILLKKGANGDQFKTIIDLAKQKNIRLQYTTDAVFDRITTGNSLTSHVHQNVIAVMDGVNYLDLSDITSKSFVLILDGITDVRNFGAIARSANCFGIDAIIVPQRGTAPINGESIKASAGALLHTPVCISQNLYFTVKTLINNGFQVIACTEKGDTPIYDFHPENYQKLAVIMGSEGKGISSQLLKLATHKVKIPMVGNISSLNVSVACGIILSTIASKLSQ